jgi:hypothetical protein
MNWEAIGAIAELFGAIGVVISFVYLAHQIRQNTQAQIRSNEWEVSRELTTNIRQFSSDADLAAVALRGFSDLNSLNHVERYRFDCAFYPWLAGFERALLDARGGHYPDEFVRTINTAIAAYLRTDGGRAWWEQRRAWFTEPFEKEVDTILSDDRIEVRGAGPIGI